MLLIKGILLCEREEGTHGTLLVNNMKWIGHNFTRRTDIVNFIFRSLFPFGMFAIFEEYIWMFLLYFGRYSI